MYKIKLNRFVGILRGGKGVWVSDKHLVLSRNQNTSIQFVYKFAPYINDKETDKSCCFNTLANTFLLSKDRLVFAIKTGKACERTRLKPSPYIFSANAELSFI